MKNATKMLLLRDHEVTIGSSTPSLMVAFKDIRFFARLGIKAYVCTE